MTVLVWNFLLALMWAITTGSFTLANLVIGFVIAYIVLGASWRDRGSRGYFSKASQGAAFLVFFLVEMTKANVRMAMYSLSPLSKLRPGVVAVPLEEMNEIELTVLANLITLTPGTLSLDVTEDRRTLYVHCMDVPSVEAVRKEIKEGFERRVLEVMR